MKQIHLIILFSVLTAAYLSSCQKGKSEKFGFIDDFSEQRVSIIDLNTYERFSDLVVRIEQLSCQDSIPAIEIQTKQTRKLVAFHSQCWEEVGCTLIKRRNKLKIINDSIQIDRRITLDSIDTYLKSHYLNDNDSYLFSENPRKAMVSVQYKNDSIGKLENLIDRITDSYRM